MKSTIYKGPKASRPTSSGAVPSLPESRQPVLRSPSQPAQSRVQTSRRAHISECAASNPACSAFQSLAVFLSQTPPQPRLRLVRGPSKLLDETLTTYPACATREYGRPRRKRASAGGPARRSRGLSRCRPAGAPGTADSATRRPAGPGTGGRQQGELSAGRGW